MVLTILLYSTFFLLSLGQLGRISVSNQQVNWYLYEIGLLAILLILVFKYGLIPICVALVKFKAIFLFLLFLSFSYILGIVDFSFYENFISYLYFLRLMFYFLFFFYLLHYLLHEKKAGQIVKNGLLIFTGLTVFVSLLQYFFYPDLRNLLYSGWDPHLFRLFGLFFDTSIAGAIFGLIFVFILNSGRQIIKNDFARKVLLGMFLLFIILTFSRSLYLSLIVTIAYIAITRRRYKEILLFIFGFLILLMIVPKPGGEGVNLTRLFSIQSRLYDYKVGIEIWKKNAFFGIGYNRIRYEKIRLNKEEEIRLAESHSGASFHSSYLIILVTSGLVGLALFLLVVYQFAVLSHAGFNLTFLIALLSLADNVFLHPFVLFPYLVLLSLLAIPFEKKQ